MKELTIMTKALLQEKRDIAIAILCGFIAGIAGVGLFSSSGYLISQTVYMPPLYTLIIIVSIVKLLGLVRALSRYIERLSSHRATFSILSRLRTSFFSRLAPLAPGIFRSKRSGDMLARIVGDIESMQFYFLRVAYPPFMLVLIFTATIIFTSVFSVWVALVFVLGMLLTTFAVPAIVMIEQRKLHGRVRMQRAELSTQATELLYGFRDLKVYGKLGEKEQILQQSAATLTQEQKASGKNLLAGQSLHAFATLFIAWAVLAVGAYLSTNGKLDGVFLAMFVLAVLTMFEEAAAMATYPAYKRDSEHAAQRLAETMSETNAPPPQPAGQLDQHQAPDIRLSDVTFQYADEWRPVLHNLQLHFPAGSKTAIVGPSGSGKTTILELILKLHAAQQGQVLLNNQPVDALDETSIWEAARVVLQSSHYFRGTIRENLMLSEELEAGSTVSDDQLNELLSTVQLPHLTLDSEVYEKGENLSDGEKQRLAIARAMQRKGRLWLLDEPTASLDAVTEQLVMRELLTQAKDDTLVLVCHRLRGLEAMDQIVVLEQGKLVEVGSYEQLLAQKGYFYQMVQLERQMLGEEDNTALG